MGTCSDQILGIWKEKVFLEREGVQVDVCAFLPSGGLGREGVQKLYHWVLTRVVAVLAAWCAPESTLAKPMDSSALPAMQGSHLT